jgi:hypothetical protein
VELLFFRRGLQGLKGLALFTEPFGLLFLHSSLARFGGLQLFLFNDLFLRLRRVIAVWCRLLAVPCYPPPTPNLIPLHRPPLILRLPIINLHLLNHLVRRLYQIGVDLLMSVLWLRSRVGSSHSDNHNQQKRVYSHIIFINHSVRRWTRWSW